MNYEMFLLKVPLPGQELIAAVSFSSGIRMFVPYQRLKLLES